ncbi:TetR/AcrR family transcriptional regulator [Streptomyces palmae]|uniref:TetR/AcrR family transcriptional regulator n=1 Tax=Streptomyces palmae TaxID=1701085 RepID=A0A4Z0GW32_9ACTN|nr:TetR/AcrR family transcriptional regulator [Streptomyces palmae]TGB00496.1 TetR/AcrR family transcriptional regulator [Streptomyces palmae]
MTGGNAVRDQGNSSDKARERAAGGTRTDRRRARTRGALIAAARAILSEQGSVDVSIQQITNQADVGFGSFYNHFASKTELFEAAVAETIEEYRALLEERTSRLTDPAEAFAAGVRLTGRLVDTHPQMARILLGSGLNCLHISDVLVPRGLRVIERGLAAGRFRVGDPRVAVAGISGSLLGLVELKMSSPALDDDVCEQMAELMLRMLGMPADEAAEVARRPLPPPSDHELRAVPMGR